MTTFLLLCSDVLLDCRLDVNTEGRAAVCDARGVLHQLLLEDGKVRLLAQYQLHYGTELRMQVSNRCCLALSSPLAVPLLAR